MGVVFLPSVCNGFCRFSILTWPRISTFLSRIVWTIHGHVLQEWTRRVFLEIVCILCADHVFWYPWFICRRIQQLCLFPFFLVCTQTYLEVCVVERIVARSVSSPEFFLLSASVCVAPFLEPLFARVGNYLFFCVHGSTRFVSSSLSYVAVSRSREKQLGTSLCLTSSSLSIFATITERS